MKRFIVCGGRDYSDWIAVFCALDRIDERFATYTGEGDERKRTPGIACIIQGGATGADALAKEWAELRGIPCETYHADWKRYNDAAGPMRNERMAKEARANGLVAFPGRRGTADMKRRAEAYGIKVWEPEK
jgi:hypothetical protein